MKTIKCRNCGKEITVSNFRVKNTKDICCSNECRYEYRKKNNGIQYNVINDFCEMIIKDKVFIIDAEDVEKVKKYTWYVNTDGYAVTSIHIGRKNNKGVYHNILLHRLLMNVEDRQYPLVDHINRNIQDNRKNNLRLADFKTNVQNSSVRKDNKTGYKCVYFNKKYNSYYAQVVRNGKIKYLGSSKTAEGAKKLYDEWVLESEVKE